jgi:integration host factor subunit alpha
MVDGTSTELPSALIGDRDRALPGLNRTAVENNLRPTLTKADLAGLLFEHLGLNKREAAGMVDSFFDEIHVALERGEPVKLSGFGSFGLRDKPERPGRNPKTGEVIPIAARRVVTFHASPNIKPRIVRIAIKT